MQIYLVGGAVRDALMGLPVKDRDWVVVGATPQELEALGFVPVGRDFPVFLHPETHEEYALARTERKTAPGYRGFATHAAPDVTLEQDLARRDLTINSIAISVDLARANGQFDIDKAYLFDPFRGRDDINRKVLRHVTAAFREDPVRILRLARLAARFPDFSVAPETRQLMCEMVQAGEVDHLVSERIWQELARGLTEKQPSRMIRILAECGALPRLLPEALPLDGALDTRALDVGAAKGASLPVCFACLCVCIAESAAKAADISTDWLKGLFERLRAPSDCRELADVLLRERVAIDQCLTFDAAALVALLERCDAFRKPQRVAELILACECLVPVGQTPPDKPYPQGRHLLKALATAQSVATDSIAATSISTGAKGPVIGEAIRLARVDAVKRDLTT